MSPDKIFILVNGRPTSLAEFFAMEQSLIKTVDASGCTALTELKADAAKTVYARGCTALTELKADAADVNRDPRYVYAGADSRGFSFEGVVLRDQWRVSAGCRNLSIEEARRHWGPGGESDRPDCLALVEKIAAAAKAMDAGVKAPVESVA